MSKVYDSFKETFYRSKATSMIITRLKGSHAVPLHDEMEELEKLVVDGLGRLKAAVKEGEAVVTGEIQQAEEVAESLKANIAALEVKLGESEDTARTKDLASQKMVTSLTAKIHNFESEVKRKDAILESRENEVNDLKSKIETLLKQVTELESAVQQAKVETAHGAERAEHVAESLRAKIAATEAQLSQTQETVRAKELTLKELEQSLSAKIQDLENQVRNKEKLLTSRERQVDDLESQVKFLTSGIKEMSSFFRRTEGLAAVETQSPGGQSKTEQEKPVIPQPKGPGFTSGTTNAAQQIVSPDFFHFRQPEGLAAVETQDPGMQLKTDPEKPGGSRKSPGFASETTNAAQQIVSPDFFERMTHELIQAIGPFASMILRDHVKALGESMETFPNTRLTELIERISQEILNEDMKIVFRKWVADSLSTATGSGISHSIQL